MVSPWRPADETMCEFLMQCMQPPEQRHHRLLSLLADSPAVPPALADLARSLSVKVSLGADTAATPGTAVRKRASL